jgi:hypothetical protein
MKQENGERSSAVSNSGEGLHLEVEDALIIVGHLEAIRSPIVVLDSWRHCSITAVFHAEAKDTASNPQLNHREKKGRT